MSEKPIDNLKKSLEASAYENRSTLVGELLDSAIKMVKMDDTIPEPLRKPIQNFIMRHRDEILKKLVENVTDLDEAQCIVCDPVRNPDETDISRVQMAVKLFRLPHTPLSGKQYANAGPEDHKILKIVSFMTAQPGSEEGIRFVD